MDVNEILLGAVVVVLLFSGVIFRFSLYYRSQVKTIKEETRRIRHKFLKNSMKMTEERDRAVREQNMMIKRRDKTIEELKKQIKQYEENEKKYQKMLKPEDDNK
ncbi:hypothetical protein [Bartonella rattimassiliensis]|uniref:Uncharacterized protein n=1 Tax=Bartonella rattimassiliensis 15908 TaxID=1094556 RepID=J1JFY6_9HYPH|nr:hypothetical protein [Bartonella rattimassiliensis]EJF83035.1 hypothetical protein MCY_01556 [Bartonella rattimassiliensis 15908]